MKPENKIDSYFERVKQNPPLISTEKVHQIINSPEALARLKGKPYNLLKFTIMTTILAVILSTFLFWMGNKAEDSRPIGNGLSNHKIVESPNASLKTNPPQTASIKPSQKSNSPDSGIQESVSAKNKPEELNEVRSENADEETTQQKGQASSVDVQQNQDNLNKLIAERNQILKNQKSTNSAKIPKIAYPKQILDSTLSISLTKRQLEDFGFVSTDSTLELFFSTEDRNMASVISEKTTWLCIDVDGYNKDERKLNKLINHSHNQESNKNIIPMMITDKLGQGWLKLFFPEEKLKQLFSSRFNKDYRTLIPVIVKRNTFKSQPTKDFIYWFLPTDEFFNRLPQAVSRGLLAEYNYVTAEDKSKLVQPECKYFDECKNTLNDIKFKVFPNPASTQAPVGFSLNEAITGRITLVDLAGRERQVLKPQTKFAIGPHQINVDVSAVPEGIYLITFYSDKGIQTQRFIVAR